MRAFFAVVVAISLLYLVTVLAVHGGTMYPLVLLPLIVVGAIALAIRSRQHAATKAVDASDEAGVCPNCASEIPLRAKECPVCNAQFGEGSAWTVAAFAGEARPVPLNKSGPRLSGRRSAVTHRLISIGLAIAIAPIPLLAFGVLQGSDDLALIASTALFNFTAPLGAVLIVIGILRPASR